MKKNIILESYNDLFLKDHSFDYTHMTKEDLEKTIDDAIDSEFENGFITIAGYHLTPSECLKKCDPIAYKEYFLNYCDAQGIEENEDGTYYDHSDDQFSANNNEDLTKECCHCCGKEYLQQELNPDNGYCTFCQADEILNGPKEFRPCDTDTPDIIIIKENAMKRWKQLHK